jgi:hypothetical protein
LQSRSLSVPGRLARSCSCRDDTTQDERTLFDEHDAPASITLPPGSVQENSVLQFCLQGRIESATAEAPARTVERRAAVYDWNWWDPWPDGLSDRQQMILQIRRDLRALEECEECDEDERDFFAQRIAGFRALLKQSGDQ